jgi:hypothetical protein
LPDAPASNVEETVAALGRSDCSADGPIYIETVKIAHGHGARQVPVDAALKMDVVDEATG